jgi:hypothetical protein
MNQALRERSKTNFDSYLEEQLQDPAFAARFAPAGAAWDVALQIAARQQAGLSESGVKPPTLQGPAVAGQDDTAPQ